MRGLVIAKLSIRLKPVAKLDYMLSILWLLRSRGQMTAEQLAEVLEACPFLIGLLSRLSPALPFASVYRPLCSCRLIPTSSYQG